MIKIKVSLTTDAGTEEYEQTDEGRFVMPVLFSIVRQIIEDHQPEVHAIATIFQTLGAMIGAANGPATRPSRAEVVDRLMEHRDALRAAKGQPL